MLRVLLRVAFLALTVTTATCQCYSPAGVAQDSTYNPCNQFNISNSACCAVSRDLCMPNGLCSWIDGNGAYTYWREGCSNPDWPDTACLKNVCGDANHVNDIGNAYMTPCDNTTTSSTWCCGQNETSCCGKGPPTEFTLRPILVAALSTTTSPVANPTATVTAVTTVQAPSPTSTSPPPGSSKSNKIAISVGVTVGIVVLAALLAGVFWIRRRGQPEVEEAPMTDLHRRKKEREEQRERADLEMTGSETMDWNGMWGGRVGRKETARKVFGIVEYPRGTPPQPQRRDLNSFEPKYAEPGVGETAELGEDWQDWGAGGR